MNPPSSRRVVVDLINGESYLELEMVKVEPREDIEFDVRGRIKGVDSEVLAELSGKDIVPAEVHFLILEENEEM